MPPSTPPTQPPRPFVFSTDGIALGPPRPAHTLSHADIAVVNGLLAQHVIWPANTVRHRFHIVAETVLGPRFAWPETKDQTETTASSEKPGGSRRARIVAAVDEAARALRATPMSINTDAFDATSLGPASVRPVPPSSDAVTNVALSHVDEALYHFVAAVIPTTDALKQLISIGRDAVEEWNMAILDGADVPTEPECREALRPVNLKAADEAETVITTVTELLWMLIRAVRLDCFYASASIVADRERSSGRPRPDTDPARVRYGIISWADINAVLEELDLTFVGVDKSKPLFGGTANQSGGANTGYDIQSTLDLVGWNAPVQSLHSAIATVLLVSRSATSIRIGVLKALDSAIVAQFGPSDGNTLDTSLRQQRQSPNVGRYRYAADAGSKSSTTTASLEKHIPQNPAVLSELQQQLEQLAAETRAQRRDGTSVGTTPAKDVLVWSLFRELHQLHNYSGLFSIEKAMSGK